MPIKLLPGEDRTGEVWFPFDSNPTTECFLITGPPIVKVKRETGKRELQHPIVHLCSGKQSVRSERSRPGWTRNYDRLFCAPGSLVKTIG